MAPQLKFTKWLFFFLVYNVKMLIKIFPISKWQWHHKINTGGTLVALILKILIEVMAMSEKESN